MSCCGNRRAAQRSTAPSAETRIRPVMQANAVHFEYGGPGALAVTGPRTGVTYRFSGAGARQAVHRADAPSLAAVPGLKPLR